MPCLRSIQLENEAFIGDWSQETEEGTSCQYANTLVMKGCDESGTSAQDLPALTQIKGDWYNFAAIGSVTITGVYMQIL